MKSALNYFAASRNAVLPRLGMLILFCAAALLTGCKSYGPLGAPDFDPTYSRTLEKNEQLLFSSWTELVDGTYMEAEQEARASYEGVMLLTNERILFAQWNEKQQRYEPAVWTRYPGIAQTKMHNNILMQYIAIRAKDDTKFTFMLGMKSVGVAFPLLMEQIGKTQKVPLPASEATEFEWRSR
ncbi:MAG: hypothetical protein ABI536_05550 [Gallionella sp.]